MGRRSKRSYRLAALKGWRTRRANESRQSGHRPKKVRRVSRITGSDSKRVPRKMWRVTVGAAYEIRARKKKNRKGNSPEKASYMVRAWYSDYGSAVSAQQELEERAIEGRDTYEDENPRAFHRDTEEEVNVAIETVEYDSGLLDVIEETNEK
jgi:hypothetical protein